MMRFFRRLFMTDHVCPWWLTYSFDNPVRRLLQDSGKLLGPYVRPGMTVMDVGAGFGYLSLGMARLVGDAGRVVAVDIQEQSLHVLMARAQKAGLAGRIQPHLAHPERINYQGKVDFILAFWMVHEVRDTDRFFGELAAILKRGGKFLMVEPKMHVSPRKFAEEVRSAERAGFIAEASPQPLLSRAMLFHE